MLRARYEKILLASYKKLCEELMKRNTDITLPSPRM
jgi:hypothetical protein